MQVKQLSAFLPILWCFLVLNLLGNALILVIILKSKEIRRKANIVFIVNGATANITFCVFVQGMSILIRSTSISPESNCGVYDIAFFLTSFVMALTIVAIALDKYFAVMKPFLYRQHNTKRTARYISISSWILATVFSVPKIKTAVFSESGSRICNSSLRHIRQTSEYVSEILTLVLVFLVPSIIIFGVYGRLIHRLWFSDQVSQATDIALLKSRRKITKLSIVVTALFVVCWIPYCIVSVWWCLGIPLVKEANGLEKYSTLFVFAYGGISPLIYAFYNEAIVREVKRLCFCGRKFCIATNLRGGAVAPGESSQEHELQVQN